MVLLIPYQCTCYGFAVGLITSLFIIILVHFFDILCIIIKKSDTTCSKIAEYQTANSVTLWVAEMCIFPMRLIGKCKVRGVELKLICKGKHSHSFCSLFVSRAVIPKVLKS